MIVFDTDVVSFVMRAAPPAALVRRIAAIPPAEQATTSITVGELVFGACRSTRPDHYLSALRDFVFPCFRVLPFETEAATICGRLRADLERRRCPVGEPDLRIAAICLHNGAELATGNVRRFERIEGLRVTDWLADFRPPPPPPRRP